MPAVLWGEQTTVDIAEAALENALVLIPLGCTEQHAAHLPVDTDTYQVERMAVEGARKAADEHGVRALVLPPLPFGPASEHYGFPGTISLSNELYVQLVKQLVWSVIDSGFKRIAVLRGCGGHWAVPGAVWDVKAEAQRAGREVTLRLVGVADDWRAIQERHFPGADGGHAAVMETALCLAGREHLVRREALRAPEVQRLQERYREGGEAFLFEEISDTGALGDPTPATVAGGEAAWEEITALFARRLAFFAEQDRELGRL
jgi:creatinine amidohydrolase